MKWKILKGDRLEEVATIVVEDGRVRVDTNDADLLYLNEAFENGTDLDVIQGDGYGAVSLKSVGPADPLYREAIRLILPAGHVVRAA